MNSENTRKVELGISVSNAKALFEQWLRATGVINDDEDLQDIVIGKATKGFSIYGKDEDVLPLKLKLRREEVKVIRHD